MVLYCECASGFCNDVGYQDEAYFDALIRMFEQALKTIAQLSASDRNPLITRLDRVRVISHNFGYGVGDDMDALLVSIAEPDAIRLDRAPSPDAQAHRKLTAVISALAFESAIVAPECNEQNTTADSRIDGNCHSNMFCKLYP